MTTLIDPTWVAVHAVEQRERAICECGHRLTQHVGRCTFRELSAFEAGEMYICNCQAYEYAGLAPR